MLLNKIRISGTGPRVGLPGRNELDRRRSRLLDRRFSHSGLPERKTLQEINWSYNPKLPKRALLELATLAFIDAKENVLLIGRPGTGKSHAAKALTRPRGFGLYFGHGGGGTGWYFRHLGAV